MELRGFVKQVLVAVVEGVREAQEATGYADSEVSPYLKGGVNISGWKGLRDMRDRALHEIEFDVAVTATEGTGSKAGAGVAVGPFILGARGESAQSSESISRVKFSVPVRLPTPSEAPTLLHAVGCRPNGERRLGHRPLPRI